MYQECFANHDYLTVLVFTAAIEEHQEQTEDADTTLGEVIWMVRQLKETTKELRTNSTRTQFMVGSLTRKVDDIVRKKSAL